MFSKSPHAEPGMNDWVMSYADMITILMAFFVVMYSLAGSKDTRRERAVFEVLRNQFGPLGAWTSHPATADIAGLKPTLSDNASPLRSSSAIKPAGLIPLMTKAQPDGERKHAPRTLSRAHAAWPGEPTRVGGVIDFALGQTELDDAQRETLTNIAEEVAGKPQKIEVRGHSGGQADCTPGRDSWDLAYARARATMEYLVSRGIDPQRLRLSVAGEHEIRAMSDDVSRHASCGRVDVFMLNEFAPRTANSAVPESTNEPESPTPDLKHF